MTRFRKYRKSHSSHNTSLNNRMEVQTASNPPYSTLITQQQQQQQQIQLQHLHHQPQIQIQKQPNNHQQPEQQKEPHNNSINNLSPASSSSEIEKELQGLDLNGSFACSGSVSLGGELYNKSNGSLSGASTASATGGAAAILTNGTKVAAGATATGATVKKRISSSRTPTRKARRIKFYRNGDRFYSGITIPVSNERYRSFESLFEDLTRLLEDNVKIPGAVRAIFTMCGRKICSLEEIEDGQSYVCSCNNESFKKIDYNIASQTIANLNISTRASNRLSKVFRPASPLKNGAIGGPGGTNGSPVLPRLMPDSVVHPRIVTLIRNGRKPRKIIRLLLNKRNSPSFDHVLTAITQAVRLDTGYVRKVFTLSGNPVVQLADFFGTDDIFFAYGTERVNNPDDFKLEPDEQKAIHAIRKTLRTAGTACQGPKPKMPIKSKNIHNVANDCVEETSNDIGFDILEVPDIIRERYVVGKMIGDGNFAVVVKLQDKKTEQTYALKIIDKSKCRGKEHYIDAEVRVMKKLQHSNIISLIMNVDHSAHMYLVLEYVGGGDLFDAITLVTRFSEDQARVMIKYLASAMSYLHSMGIVHRDVKPENLLVELDKKGNIAVLKLADFGLACEVTEPLFAVCGTPTYVAPEILMESGYGLKIDVWAAGVILYIVLCGFPPFVSTDNEQEPLFDAILSGVYEFPDPYWSDIGEGVRDLIANMLQSDPDVRFTSEDVLDHYWIIGEGEDSDYS